MSLMKRIFSTESTGKRLSIAFLDTGISPWLDFILPKQDYCLPGFYQRKDSAV